MTDKKLCPSCHGCGLNFKHPKIHDIPAGKYTEEHVCKVCKGTGYDPRYKSEKR